DVEKVEWVPPVRSAARWPLCFKGGERGCGGVFAGEPPSPASDGDAYGQPSERAVGPQCDRFLDCAAQRRDHFAFGAGERVAGFDEAHDQTALVVGRLAEQIEPAVDLAPK